MKKAPVGACFHSCVGGWSGSRRQTAVERTRLEEPGKSLCLAGCCEKWGFTGPGSADGQAVLSVDRPPIWPFKFVRLPGGFSGRVRNPTLAPSLSAQIVPDPSAFAVLVEGAAFDQCPEVLLERIATGPGQLDGIADGHATMLASELDDL